MVIHGLHLRGVKLVSALATCCIVLALTDAESQVWNSTLNNRQWTDSTYWSPTSVPNAVDASATLGNIITTNRSIQVSSGVTLGTLDFSSTNYRYILSGSGSLTFETSGGPAEITASGTGGGGNGYRINLPLILESDLEVDAGAPLQINNSISGVGGLSKSGNGIVRLTGSSANSFSGNTTVESGALHLQKSGGATALAGPVTIGDGVGATDSAMLRIQNSEQISDTSDVTILSDGRLQINNNRVETIRSLDSSDSTARVHLANSSSRIIVDSGVGGPDSNYGGLITGSGRLRKDGDATLTLSGNNSYSGRTEIFGGKVSIDADNRLGAAPGSFVQTQVTLDSGGTLQTTDTFTLNSNRGVRVQNGGGGIETAAGTTLTYGGRITGSADFTKSGEGTLQVTGSGTNNYSGTTTISEGTMVLAKNSGVQAIGSGDIFLQDGGTLLLENSNQIANSTALELAGGTFSTGTGWSESLGPLTLTSDSTISLGSAAHLLQFASANLVSWVPGASLTIFGWEGAAESSGTAGQIRFASIPSFTQAQLNNISFSGYGVGAMLVGDELVPVAVPEAQSLIAAVLLIAFVFWRDRARIVFFMRTAIRAQRRTSLPPASPSRWLDAG